jgi:hypothetical protein
MWKNIKYWFIDIYNMLFTNKKMNAMYCATRDLGVKCTGKYINKWEHSSWGDRIQCLGWEKKNFVCWLSIGPKNGDELRIKMNSGKVGRFLIYDVNWCCDPSDMYFFKVKGLGYLERYTNDTAPKEKWIVV